MADWTAIRADYLETRAPYSALAKKWDVPLSTLKKRAMRERWATGFRKPGEEPKEEPVPLVPVPELEPAERMTRQELAEERKLRQAQRMIETTDAMMDRIIDALGLIAPDNTYALATLIKALKDLREMQGLNRSALDIEEQKARIAKLQHDALTEDKQREPLVVQFVNMDGADI